MATSQKSQHVQQGYIRSSDWTGFRGGSSESLNVRSKDKAKSDTMNDTPCAIIALEPNADRKELRQEFDNLLTERYG